MGCFSSAFRFVYAVLGVVSIVIILIMLGSPTYRIYNWTLEPQFKFMYNPPNWICMRINDNLCPAKNESSFFYMMVTIMLLICVPIIIVCSVLNFVMAMLCCPFGPYGVNGATGLCALLVILSMAIGYISRNNIDYVGYHVTMGATFYLGLLQFVILIAMMILSFFASFLSKFCL